MSCFVLVFNAPSLKTCFEKAWNASSVSGANSWRFPPSRWEHRGGGPSTGAGQIASRRAAAVAGGTCYAMNTDRIFAPPSLLRGSRRPELMRAQRVRRSPPLPTGPNRRARGIERSD